MKKILITCAALAALAARALAADMPVTAAVYKAPPRAAVYDWTGFYAGLNAGYGWGHTSADIVSSDPASTAFLTQHGASGPAFSSSFASSVPQSGGIVGVQAGYNRQIASKWIAGFETDIQSAHVTGSFFNRIFVDPGLFGTGFPLDLTSQRMLDWFGTVRGRLGFLVTPNLLVYGTGGLAYGETGASGRIALAPPVGFDETVSPGGGLTFACSATAPAASTCYAGSNSRTSVGFAAGAGFEYRLRENLTAKLEYLHIDLGGETVTLNSPSPPSTPGVFLGYGFDHQGVEILRVGLNYKFGGPVAAKY